MYVQHTLTFIADPAYKTDALTSGCLFGCIPVDANRRDSFHHPFWQDYSPRRMRDIQHDEIHCYDSPKYWRGQFSDHYSYKNHGFASFVTTNLGIMAAYMGAAEESIRKAA